jgi:hypothetical protein
MAGDSGLGSWAAARGKVVKDIWWAGSVTEVRDGVRKGRVEATG